MINLYSEYYFDKDPKRRDELLYCLIKNGNNPLIDKLYIFGDFDDRTVDVLIKSKPNKIKRIITSKRLTYKAFFIHANANTQSDNDINILINSDIYLDETITNCHEVLNNECYAILRHEVNEDFSSQIKLIGSRGMLRSDSQDAWIFKGKIKDIKECDFSLGIAGCDNRIAYLISEAGYNVKNPCHKIKIYHYHNSGVRNYMENEEVKERIEGDYLLVKPEDNE